MKYYYELVDKLYNLGALSLRQVFNLVIVKNITKEDFHTITGYNYDGLKETKGW
jgi:hypothetical protein